MSNLHDKAKNAGGIQKGSRPTHYEFENGVTGIVRSGGIYFSTGHYSSKPSQSTVNKRAGK